jgi:hypothetical protein
MWDTGTGKELRTLEGHAGPVEGCAVASDGSLIVSAGSDGTVKVWDTTTGELRTSLGGHAGPVRGCSVAPDSIVSANSDGTLKVWETATGRELATLAGHGGPVNACAISPDGTSIVSASSDGTLKVWEAATGRELATLAGHGGPVNACAISPDGTSIVSASSDATLRIWRSTESAEAEVSEGPSVSKLEAVEARAGAAPDTPYLDEDVQFSVYRPGAVEPAKWYPLLAFAHLSEIRPEEEAEVHPLERVEQEARQVLGDRVEEFRKVTQDSRQAVPREGELSFLPEVPGIEFNPQSRTFLWLESVHREEFRLRASQDLDGQTARGQMTVYLGSILLAEIPLSIRVDSVHAVTPTTTPMESAQARPYRKIFASYSHKDAAIVEQFAAFASAIGDRYLIDVQDLRAGEIWSDRLADMIEEADVFQLFWSWNSMRSTFVEREWKHALALNRRNFVRPTYWEEPLPETRDGSLPPGDLRSLHFQRIPVASEGSTIEAESRLARSEGWVSEDEPLAEGVDLRSHAEVEGEARALREAVMLEDWDSAVHLLRRAIETSGAPDSEALKRSLATALGNRAAETVRSGNMRLLASSEARTRTEDRESHLREGIAFLRRARSDLTAALAADPTLDEVKELLHQVEANIRAASGALASLGRREAEGRAMEARPAAPPDRPAPADMPSGHASLTLPSASRVPVVVAWAVLLIGLAILSLVIELPVGVRIGAMVVAAIVVAYGLEGRGPWSIVWGLVAIGLVVVSFLGLVAPLRIGAIAVVALLTVLYGLRHRRR